MIRDIIGPLWETKTNTAQKALTYLRQIFNWSIALRIREDRENPADLRSALGVSARNLKNEIDAKKKIMLPSALRSFQRFMPRWINFREPLLVLVSSRSLPLLDPKRYGSQLGMSSISKTRYGIFRLNTTK